MFLLVHCHECVLKVITLSVYPALSRTLPAAVQLWWSVNLRVYDVAGLYWTSVIVWRRWHWRDARTYHGTFDASINVTRCLNSGNLCSAVLMTTRRTMMMTTCSSDTRGLCYKLKPAWVGNKYPLLLGVVANWNSPSALLTVISSASGTWTLGLWFLHIVWRLRWLSYFSLPLDQP